MKYLFLLLPFFGHGQCDSIKVYEVRWCVENVVGIACPDGILGCAVFHAKLETDCISKRFDNYDDANELYNRQKQINTRTLFLGTAKHPVELKIYKLSVKDLLNETKRR
jgi:hypothetical protein